MQTEKMDTSPDSSAPSGTPDAVYQDEKNHLIEMNVSSAPITSFETMSLSDGSKKDQTANANPPFTLWGDYMPLPASRQDYQELEKNSIPNLSTLSINRLPPRQKRLSRQARRAQEAATNAATTLQSLLKVTALQDPDSVLIIHVAMSYTRKVGLGIGLVRRLACAETDETQSQPHASKTNTDLRILTVSRHDLKAATIPLGGKRFYPKAHVLALQRALQFATESIESRWLNTAAPAPAAVVVLFARPCEDFLRLLRYHLEHEPESLVSHSGAGFKAIKNVIQAVQTIKTAGNKVSIGVSGDRKGRFEARAAKEADARFEMMRVKQQNKALKAASERAQAPEQVRVQEEVVEAKSEAMATFLRERKAHRAAQKQDEAEKLQGVTMEAEEGDSMLGKGAALLWKL